MKEEEINLTDNENNLLSYCMGFKRSVNDIAKYIGVSPASVSVMVNKLDKLGKVKVDRRGHGKKTLVRTKKGDKTESYFTYILGKIKERGGQVDYPKEYMDLLPVNLDDRDFDKYNAPKTLVFTKYLKRKIHITEEGKKFLQKFEDLEKEDNIEKMERFAESFQPEIQKIRQKKSQK